MGPVKAGQISVASSLAKLRAIFTTNEIANGRTFTLVRVIIYANQELNSTGGKERSRQFGEIWANWNENRCFSLFGNKFHAR